MTLKQIVQTLCLCLITSVSGCGYPKVSPTTYELSKALYSACNRQHTEQLVKVDALIEMHLENETIPEREAGWLQKISAQAHAGEWASAAKQTRELLKDQVR